MASRIHLRLAAGVIWDRFADRFLLQIRRFLFKKKQEQKKQQMIDFRAANSQHRNTPHLKLDKDKKKCIYQPKNLDWTPINLI